MGQNRQLPPLSWYVFTSWILRGCQGATVLINHLHPPHSWELVGGTENVVFLEICLHPKTSRCSNLSPIISINSGRHVLKGLLMDNKSDSYHSKIPRV
jgi:hypothetical protein